MRYFVFLCLFCLISCKQNPKSENTNGAEQESTAKTEAPELKIYPVEHATAVLKWDDLTLYIDPVGGADTFKGYPSPDLILITDIHGDHLSIETLEALDTGKAKIIVPQAVADELP
ncbi:MAG: MBL fold metallo-hydrolase, partial [Eudoraea sp.]|nr:MBL fold metallo-hydrolase [Eudoraea sp.]